MAVSGVDDLFGKPKIWLDGVSPEAREFIDEIVEAIRVRGREPVWAWVFKRLQDEHPESTPNSVTTVRDNLRALV